MPSLLQTKSYGSVRVFWLDRELALERADHCARELLANRPEVTRVGIVGSVARKTCVPGSDLDVLLVLRVGAQNPVHRGADYEPFFAAVGLPVDLFCVTEQETSSSPFYVRNSADALWVARSET